jgi:hypothetical protein
MHIYIGRSELIGEMVYNAPVSEEMSVHVGENKIHFVSGAMLNGNFCSGRVYPQNKKHRTVAITRRVQFQVSTDSHVYTLDRHLQIEVQELTASQLLGQNRAGIVRDRVERPERSD